MPQTVKHTANKDPWKESEKPKRTQRAGKVDYLFVIAGRHNVLIVLAW